MALQCLNTELVLSVLREDYDCTTGAREKDRISVTRPGLRPGVHFVSNVGVTSEGIPLFILRVSVDAGLGIKWDDFLRSLERRGVRAG